MRLAKKKFAVCGFVILIIFVLTSHSTNASFTHSIPFQETVNNHILADDIVITCDNDWVLQGWPGNGTIDSPYVIDGFIENSVKITNSTKWFVLQNSFVPELIQLTNVTNGRIEFTSFQNMRVYQSMNVSISNNTQDVVSITLDSCNRVVIANNSMLGASVLYEEGRGITIRLSQDIKILSNTIQEFCTGIEIENSSDCCLEKNYITRCGIYVVTTPTPPPVPLGRQAFTPSESQYETIKGEGIRLENCTSSIVIDNNIVANDCSNIVLAYCNDTLIYDNNMTLNREGMILQDCTSFNVTSNLIDHGLTVQSSLSGVIADNKLQLEGLSLEGDLECLLHSISNNTVDEELIIYLASVNSYTLLTQTVAQVILVNCTQVFVQEVIITTDFGIHLLFSENCRFRYITSEYFLVRNSYNVVLEDANIYGWSGYGIVIDSARLVTIVENYLSCGILVRNYSNEIFVRNNSQSEVRASAIRVESTASSVFIEGNDIRWCGRSQYYGWYIPYTYYGAIDILGKGCSIFNNMIVDNYGWGIILQGENITVCYNTIARNNMGNALDHGSDNYWDDGESRGNEWGDYIGFGYYYIPGDAGSVDRYPSLSSEFMEQSVIIVWAVLVGTPITFIILIGLIIFIRRRDRVQASKPVQIKRVGLG